MTAQTYAHMCRDGHPQIGHNQSTDPEELACPICFQIVLVDGLRCLLESQCEETAALRAEVERLKAAVQESNKAVWLIEANPPDSDLNAGAAYYTGYSCEKWNVPFWKGRITPFSSNVEDALRFSREQDARTVLRGGSDHELSGIHAGWAVNVVEHVWMTGPLLKEANER